MDFLHLHGVVFIQWLQQYKCLEDVLIYISHVGGPLLAYALIFPVAYYVNPQLGLVTMLCASFSEWLSGILKWILHGHRPYWWVRVHAQMTGTPVLPIRQFAITCETSPGSPSGHCMVTLAALVPLVIHLHRCLPSTYRNAVVLSFACFVVMLGLSRCYVAAHFPHQVIAGIFTGLFLGYSFTLYSDVLRLTDHPVKVISSDMSQQWIAHILRHPGILVWLGFSSLTLAWLFGWFLQSFCGLDINWSITFAQLACNRPEWVHLASSLMVGFARIAGYLSGLSLALCFSPPTNLLASKIALSVIPTACFALLITKWFESLLRRFTHSYLPRLLPSVDGDGPSHILLVSSVLEGAVGPLVAVWLLPKLLSVPLNRAIRS